MWRMIPNVFAPSRPEPSDPPPAPAPEPARVPTPLSDTASPHDPPAEDDEVARKLAACEAKVREIEALEAGSAPAPAPAPTSPAARAAFDLAQAPAPASPPSSTRAPPSPTPSFAAPAAHSSLASTYASAPSPAASPAPAPAPGHLPARVRATHSDALSWTTIHMSAYRFAGARSADEDRGAAPRVDSPVDPEQ